MMIRINDNIRKRTAFIIYEIFAVLIITLTVVQFNYPFFLSDFFNWAVIFSPPVFIVWGLILLKYAEGNIDRLLILAAMGFEGYVLAKLFVEIAGKL